MLLLNQKLINPPSLLIHHEMKILRNPDIQAVILETVTGPNRIRVVVEEVALEVLVDQVDQAAEVRQAADRRVEARQVVDHQEAIRQLEV